MIKEDIDAAAAALSRGDFGGARKLLLRLRGEARGEDAKEVQRLLGRLRPDTIVGLGFVCDVVLFVIVLLLSRSAFTG